MKRYDLIWVEADDCYYAMPRGDNGALSLQYIYERSQQGSSGLFASTRVPKERVEALLKEVIAL